MPMIMGMFEKISELIYCFIFQFFLSNKNFEPENMLLFEVCISKTFPISKFWFLGSEFFSFVYTTFLL